MLNVFYRTLVKESDIIVRAELSRLGRSFFMIMSILSGCRARGVKIWTVKDNYRLGDDIQSNVSLQSARIGFRAVRGDRAGFDLAAHEGRAGAAQGGGARFGEAAWQGENGEADGGHEKEIRRMVREGKNNAEIGRAFGFTGGL